MQWVKLHVSLRHNRLFQRLSKNAKLAFLGALMAAGEYDQNGVLTTRQGPLTDAELASDLLLTRKESTLAVKELVHFGFMEQLIDGSLAIAKWDEKTAPVSTPRVRKHREKAKLETLHETLETLRETLQPVSRNSFSETDIEEEVEVEEDLSLRDSTRAADSLSDFLLAEGISQGIIAEHRRLDPGAWRHHNREASLNLVSTYGLKACKSRALAMFAACKAGKIRNSGGQYTAVLLSRVWDYRELQQATPVSDDLMDEFRRLG